MSPSMIGEWVNEFRSSRNQALQLNLWVPDPPPKRDNQREAAVRAFLGQWGPAVPPEAGDAAPLDFQAQCQALLAAAPPVVSSIMGLYPPAFVSELKQRGIAWFATITTVSEAVEAEAAGADVIVAQGYEAGGHRAAFDAARAEHEAVGLLSLLPAVVDAVRIPVVATGGIGDGRGIAAALALGASAAQIGTAFLRSPEAKIHSVWASALATTRPEGTRVTRAFSGRSGRSIATDYVRAAMAPGAPEPAPYPVQRGLTASMREGGQRACDVHRMQVWAGQSASLARAEPAGAIVQRVWDQASGLLH
jgi:nitronate monooxygenase